MVSARPATWGALILSVLILGSACAPLQKIDEASLGPKTESTKILTADGSLITTLRQEENREIIPIDQIPKHLRDAVVAIEDARFYTHLGIDAKAILRALYANAKTGKVVEGGSTITQQLVRNALAEVGKEQTIERKLREAQYAYNVDESYAKDKILELYLNTVYFGEGAYGVQTASQAYFNKDVKDVTLAEGALLAGLIRAPVTYDPRINAELALERRNRVLDRMFVNGFADAAGVAVAKGEESGVKPKVESTRYEAAYFVDYVTRLIQRSDEFEKLGETEQARGDALFRKGLRVFTTIDMKMQNAAEEAIAKVLDRPGDPSATLVAIETKTGHIKAIVGGKDFFASQEEDPCVIVRAINADGSPKTCAKVNLALGLGGGGSGRQSGSAFKPFVLATAIQKGITLDDVYQASGCISIPNADAGGTKPWRVCNYEDQAFGPVSVREATYKSINTVYAQIIADIGGRVESRSSRKADAGAREVVATAERMGICGTTQPLMSRGTCKLAAVPSAALGANAVSTLDMASAFTAFPNLGVHRTPIGILKITDARGNILWKPVERQTQVIDPGVAYLTTQAMEDVIARGTGSRNGKIGRPAFGKTGTSQEWRDAWFVGGAGTDLVAAVSVFWPDGEIEMKPSCSGRRTEYIVEKDLLGHAVARPPACRTTRIRVAGGTWPTQIWQLFMLKALEGIPASTFPVPQVETRKVAVDYTRGCLPNPYTPQELIRVQSYIQGTEPTEVCAEPTGPVAEAVVPNVVGFPEAEAIKLLEAQGFVVARQFEPSGLYPPGRVVGQSPEGGKNASPGSTVTILVAITPQKQHVPDVIGLSEQNAEQKLAYDGFKVKIVREGGCGPNDPDCFVWDQSPDGGEKVDAGSGVTIFVKRKPPPPP